MKTLLSVVNSFYTEEIDSLEDRDEMLADAITYLMGKVDKGMIINNTISSWINVIARHGVIEFLRKKYDMPVGLIKNPQDRLFVLTKVKDEIESGFSTRDSIEDLANDLSEKTGADKKEILNWLMFLNAGRDAERKKLPLEQEGDIYFATEASVLKEQIGQALDTLNEREKRVLELNFGLEEGSEELSYSQIGEKLNNVSRENIRQIRARALRRLRHPSRTRKLRDYVNSETTYGYIRGEDRRHNLPARAEQQKDFGTQVDLSLKALRLGEGQIAVSVASGIKEIGDFFKKSPEELANDWLGSPKGLASIMRKNLMPILSNIFSKLKARGKFSREEMKMFMHITGSMLLRFNMGVSIEPIRIAVYEKAYEELYTFINKVLDERHAVFEDLTARIEDVQQGRTDKEKEDLRKEEQMLREQIKAAQKRLREIGRLRNEGR